MAKVSYKEELKKILVSRAIVIFEFKMVFKDFNSSKHFYAVSL